MGKYLILIIDAGREPWDAGFLPVSYLSTALGWRGPSVTPFVLKTADKTNRLHSEVG